MSQQAELLDTLALDFDAVRVAAPVRPISARRALALWVGLSVGGWCVLAALVGLVTF